MFVFNGLQHLELFNGLCNSLFSLHGLHLNETLSLYDFHTFVICPLHFSSLKQTFFFYLNCTKSKHITANAHHYHTCMAKQTYKALYKSLSASLKLLKYSTNLQHLTNYFLRSKMLCNFLHAYSYFFSILLQANTQNVQHSTKLNYTSFA